jgi:hypothetical protein
MHFSIHDIKAALYVLQTLIGIFLLGLSICLFQTAGSQLEPISQLVCAVVIFAVGACSTFFGIETFLLRDDPDIWR